MQAKITLVLRILLGLAFFAAGLVYWLGVANPPPDLPERLQTFNAGMAASGYLLELVKALEVICGLLLIAGFFVPLALVILAAITLNIFLVHAFMAPEGVPVALVLGLLLIYLGFFAEPYRHTIRALFRLR